jgi:hypothetical protein
MPSCPRYQIFVSYAHVDNEAGDLDGWGTHLVRELERRVSGLIAQLKGLGDPDYAQTLTQDEQLRWQVADTRLDGCPIGALARALVSPSALGPERALLFADLQKEKRKRALEGDAAFVAATVRRGPLGLVEVSAKSLFQQMLAGCFSLTSSGSFRFRNEGPANVSQDSISEGSLHSRSRAVGERGRNIRGSSTCD